MRNVTFTALARPDEAAQKRRARTLFWAAVIGYAAVLAVSRVHLGFLIFLAAPTVFLYQSWASQHSDMETKLLTAMASWGAGILHVWLPGSVKFAGTYCNQHVAVSLADLLEAKLDGDGKLCITAKEAKVSTTLLGRESKPSEISGIEVSLEVSEEDREKVAAFLDGIDAPKRPGEDE